MKVDNIKKNFIYRPFRGKKFGNSFEAILGAKDVSMPVMKEKEERCARNLVASV